MIKKIVLFLFVALLLVGCGSAEEKEIKDDLMFYFEEDIVRIDFEDKIVKVTFENDLVKDLIVGANANLSTVKEFQTLQEFQEAWSEVSEYHDEYEFWLVNEKYLDEPLKTKRGKTK